MTYETADILDGAADIIERCGLWQGQIGRPGTCIANAIWSAASRDLEAAAPVRLTMARHLGLDETNATTGLFTWNDDPGRTKQEVLDALRLAAKQERIAADGAA